MAEKEEEAAKLRALSAAVYPACTPDEEGASRWRSVEYLRRRRGVLFCCGCCGALVVVLGFVALVLALTALKVRDPVLTMKSIHVRGLRAGAGAPSSVDATLTADVSVRNPNLASYKIRNSTTEFYYRGRAVGAAQAPGGVVPARSEVRMNVTAAAAMTYRAADLGELAGDMQRGSVNLTSHTEIGGVVSMVGVFRRELHVFLNCSMTVELSVPRQDVGNLACGATTR